MWVKTTYPNQLDYTEVDERGACNFLFGSKKKTKKKKKKKKNLRGPGIEPGSTAWKAAMLTITPATLLWISIAANHKKIKF